MDHAKSFSLSLHRRRVGTLWLSAILAALAAGPANAASQSASPGSSWSTLSPARFGPVNPEQRVADNPPHLAMAALSAGSRSGRTSLAEPTRMQNLFRAELTESHLAALLERTRGASILPPLGAPEWADAARKAPVAAWLERLRERAVAAAFRPMPQLTDELYALFHQTGQRRPFENVYVERRRSLARVAMVVLLGGEGERQTYLPDLVAKLRETMDEPAWALPAHVNHPSGKDPLMLDLLAAETANLMAEMLAVFGDKIPSELAGGIKARLRRQFFENYLQRNAQLPWVRAGMNWNAVCHQGIVGAALTIEDDPVLVARILMSARQGLPHFLDGFGADGSTSEGPGYWQYGFGWFAELNEQLERRTAGALSLFEGEEKVRRIAHFAPHLVLRNGYFVNFSDNERRGILRAPLLAYLGGRLDSPLLQDRAADSYRQLRDGGFNADDRRADFFYLSRLVLRCPELLAGAAASAAGEKDVFFPNYEALVARGGDEHGHYWEFAAKAGSNNEHHNHNDCGTFILHVDGAPAVMEIGAPEYVRDYFNEQRYTFLSARSAGHSVPRVNGFEQAAGEPFNAEVIRSEITDDRVEFVMDLAKCYPPEARCRRLIRTFVFDKRAGRLTVRDEAEFDGGGTLESAIIADGRVGHDAREAWIETPAGRMRLTPAEGTVLAGLDHPEYRNRQEQPATVNRLFLRAGATAASSKTEYTIELAGPSLPESR